MTLRCLLKPLLLVACLLAVSARPGSTAPTATDAQQPESHPLLLELRPRLEAVLLKTHPGATLEIKGSELVAQFKTRQFMVYTIQPNGAVGQKLHEETGPQNGGFLLCLRVFPKVPAFATSTPRGGQPAYWREYIDRYNVRVKKIEVPNLPSPLLSEDEIAQEAISQSPDVPPGHRVYQAFSELAQAGLVSNKYANSSPSVVRYEATIDVAYLLRKMPELQQNKSARLEALQKAIANNNVRGLPEAEKLDNYLQELLTEFYGELQAFGIEINQPNLAQAAAGAWKPQYITMNFSWGLGHNAPMLNATRQILTDFAKEKNKATDELIYLEAAK